jgi:hypothetical protein
MNGTGGTESAPLVLLILLAFRRLFHAEDPIKTKPPSLAAVTSCIRLSLLTPSEPEGKQWRHYRFFFEPFAEHCHVKQK